MHRRSWKMLILLAMLLPAVAQSSATQAEVDIPFQRFVLDNGLTLIVHEDHKAPIVAVNIWYHVGSKNEKRGKSGFAHLFEHLMFNGSEHYDDDYFQVMDRIGATDINGTTNEDRTNYFENVPTSALDVALWMESDRMGHMLGAITQEKLDEQRGVVQNEKRQGENQPYGVAYELFTKSTWPMAHPYSWTVIGSMEDLNAASLDDVKEWFKTYYGPSNAVLVIAGDIDTKTAYDKVKQYFGEIPPGPPVSRHDQWIAKRSGEQRQQVQDRVPAARIYKSWNVPQWGARDLANLRLAAMVLGSGKTSRLFKRLMYDEQIASDVDVDIDDREIASQFDIDVTAKPGGDLAPIEKAIDEEMARFLREGPTEAELQRAKTQYNAAFIRGIERIGGFGGKSDVLAINEVYAGRPDYFKTFNGWINAATVADVKNAANRWLSDGVYVLQVTPFPQLTYDESAPERVANQLPPTGTPPMVKFPELQRFKMANGLNVLLAERHSVPVVNFNLLVDAGYAADQFASPGTASLAMDLLDEGTSRRSALQISDELSSLGAQLSTSSNLDMSIVSLSAIKSNLDASLDIFADVILNPAFPEKEFTRLQKQRISDIQQEKVQPVRMALRVLPRFLYGEGHAYGNPLTGSGTEEAVKNMRPEDLKKFHQTWFKAGNATLVVVGDVTRSELQPLLEKRFGKWADGAVPQKNISTVAEQSASTVYLMDRPGSLQSMIIAGQVAPPKANPDEIAIEAMNNILGGQFTSRVNMNLREDKHWAYGAFTFFVDARGQRPLVVYAPVQTDKTSESLSELLKELRDIVSTRPPAAEELEKVKNNMVLELPGSWETNNEVSGAINEIVRFGYADDYFNSYSEKVEALSLSQVQAVAGKIVKPARMVWVVVGDRARIEQKVRDLNLGEVHFIDAEGTVLDDHAQVVK